MEDILSLKSYEDFMSAIGRNSAEYDEVVLEVNPDKMKRVMSIAAKIINLSDCGFFGMSITPSGRDIIMRVRCDNLFIDGENVLSATPYLKMLQDVSEISAERFDGHILLELRISNVFEDVDEEAIWDEIFSYMK